jgi:hypothetical protein
MGDIFFVKVFVLCVKNFDALSLCPNMSLSRIDDGILTGSALFVNGTNRQQRSLTFGSYPVFWLFISSDFHTHVTGETSWTR